MPLKDVVMTRLLSLMGEINVMIYQCKRKVCMRRGMNYDYTLLRFPEDHYDHFLKK